MGHRFRLPALGLVLAAFCITAATGTASAAGSGTQRNVVAKKQTSLTTTAKKTAVVQPVAPTTAAPKSNVDAPRYPVDISAGRWTAATYWGHWTFPYWEADGSDGHPAYSNDLPKIYYWSSFAATDWNLPKDADLGKAVYAIQSGVVEKVDARYGDVVIKHTVALPLKDGTSIATWYSEYGHMRDIAVRVGQTVDKGVTVGTVGDVGAPGSAHLHFVISSNRSSGANIKAERAWAISPSWVVGDLGSDEALYADELTTAAMRIIRYPADLYPATLLAKCCSYTAAA